MIHACKSSGLVVPNSLAQFARSVSCNAATAHTGRVTSRSERCLHQQLRGSPVKAIGGPGKQSYPAVASDAQGGLYFDRRPATWSQVFDQVPPCGELCAGFRVHCLPNLFKPPKFLNVGKGPAESGFLLSKAENVDSGHQCGHRERG